jgi:hypothetical protein
LPAQAEAAGQQPVTEPSPEPASEPAIKPIVIGSDEVPEVEKKRGWWRR